jgi:hypothetical protein
MQKGITPFVIVDEDAEAIKEDKLMRKRAKRTIDENLWDSVWLSKLYPSRYYDFYEKWELGEEQFDPALHPDRLIREEEESLELESELNDNIKVADWYRDNK